MVYRYLLHTTHTQSHTLTNTHTGTCTPSHFLVLEHHTLRYHPHYHPQLLLLYSSQGLSADIPPVRRIVRILATDLARSSIPLDSKNMGNIMYGMQKMTMTSRNRQVRELLSSISIAFKMTPHPLSAQAVGNCFYGTYVRASSTHLNDTSTNWLCKNKRTALHIAYVILQVHS